MLKPGFFARFCDSVFQAVPHPVESLCEFNKFIFPFQEEADVMFNSALVYEVPVLKVPPEL